MRYGMTNPSGQVWRSIDEAAAALGVCERTVRRRVERGEFTVQRVGGILTVQEPAPKPKPKPKTR